MIPDNSHTLLRSDGRVRLGQFDSSLARINGRDCDYRTPMGAPASPLQKHFHYKQFQYFGVVSERLLIGCAFADTAWLGLAFVYLYDLDTGKLEEFTWRSPFARQLNMSESPRQGDSQFERAGVRIHMGYEEHPDSGALVKTLSLKSKRLEINARMCEDSAFEPMSICTRIGINGWVYANKVAGVPVSGQVRFDDRQWDLADLDACGHHDFSAGYMRRETFWNWACLSGRSEGQALGFNLSCGVNETSWTENCLWLNGKLHKVNLMRFDYNGDDLMAPWRVCSDDGIIDLTFTPAGRHREKLNLALFASNFNQLFGRFDGTIQLPGEAVIAVDGMNGFVEEQYAKW